MIHERTRLLIGDDGLEKLAAARVAVVGLGGVGAAAAEELCRAGIGRLCICDFDTVKDSNINRQLIALHSTLGKAKSEVMAERLRDINPELSLEIFAGFLGPDELPAFDIGRFDFVLDCIDSLNPKVALIRACVEAGVEVVTATGAGGRIDPEGVRVMDLFATKNCRLAMHLRKRLRHQGVFGPLAAVSSGAMPFATALPQPEAAETERGRSRRPIGSIAFVPVVFGCIMAAYVTQRLLGLRAPVGPVGKAKG